MANDHYISRFLTRRWEVEPGRRLHFFDFESGEFGEEGSRWLFAADGLHSKEVGDRLNELVEQPVARLLRQLEKDPRAHLADPEDWKTFRALAALFLLQAPRLRDAKAQAAVASALTEGLAGGESAIDAMGRFADEQFDLLVGRVPVGERLFFTEVAYFPVPLLGCVVVAIPLSPDHFFTLAPKDADMGGLNEVLATQSLISGLSIGVSTKVRRVLLPPATVPHVAVDSARVRAGMISVRDSARAYIEVLARATAAVGLRSWSVA